MVWTSGNPRESKGRKIVLFMLFLVIVELTRLALHSLTYGVSTLRRLMKYSKQGFTVCSGILADILMRTVNEPGTINDGVVSLD